MQVQKRIRQLLLIVLTPLLFVVGPVEAATLNVVAPSAYLLDTDTGQVLLSKNADEQRAMASTTKMVTALLVLEAGELNTLVTVSARADKEGGSSLGLYFGEIMSRDELLWGLLLKSGNDAAIALAESVSGSVEEFVEDMNVYAAEVGADSTHFANPNGMPDPEHYSTAKDLGVLAEQAMKHSEFRKIVATEKHTIPKTNKFEAREYENHNRLIGNYAYATGIKTGFTNNARHCLVSSATKDDINLVAIVLGGSSPQNVADESQRILEWGYSLYSNEVLVAQGEEVGAVSLEGVKDTLALVSGVTLEATIAEDSHLRRITAYTGDLAPPIAEGQEMGEVILMSGDKRVGAVSLLAEHEVKAPSFLSEIVAASTALFAGLFTWIGSIF